MTGRNTDDIQMQLAHAGSLVESGKLLEAEIICRQILDANPENVNAHYLLGLIYQNTGQAGLGELVAADTDEYQSLAGELANDIDRLCGLRQSLRERMATSSLCDGTRFTRDLEAAFREMTGKPTGN